MKNYLFTGLSKTGSWVEGELLTSDINDKASIITETIDDGVTYISPKRATNIIPESISQYTGIKDRNQNKIYDNSIILFNDQYCEVKWTHEYMGYRIDNHITSTALNPYHINDYQVVGNMYQHSSLLKSNTHS